MSQITENSKERIQELFLSLCSLDSISFHEKHVMHRVKLELQRMGFEVSEDGAAEAIGGTSGNLYGILKGNSDREALLFSSHMDTVEPGQGKKAQLDGDRITSDGTTVLGADDVCGIVEILEGIRLAEEEAAEHGDIEVLFTVAEEVYGQGARVFDYDRIRARDAYVLDMSGAPGEAARKAPSIVSFDMQVKGMTAHAGYAPEDGINALQAAARAIARIPQGHVTDTATLNIGTLQAGEGRNIVAGNCRCSGEVRSFNHEEALKCVKQVREVFQEETQKIGAELDFEQKVHIRAYETPEDAEVCRRFQAACKNLGFSGELKETHGGSDNNIFAEKGLSGIVLSCGMHRTHSTEEYTSLSEMEAGARLVAAIIGQRQEENH